ncbi:GntR family transcriptional regulator [Nitratireductor basaltis]|uniref:Transcriptional regulatory protein n=1 Tax=Nitratireductor basaltis TaxID=472175 RepID=A0A084U636_9HYPH|nr:GntR family transcriptional regulator [Nitratireductor basaltis]KFB08422.1 Transcriptional regulatory protein [Nitratireductor basaltis]
MKPIPAAPSLMMQTADRIREAIIRGELKLGSKVSEQRLADVLRVSRSPVREALAVLQMEGLINVLPKRGSFVFTPDLKMVSDLCDHRAVLEAACLRFAIRDHHDVLMKKIRHGLDDMQRAIDAGDNIAYSFGDMTFHKSIVESSGNRSIASAYTRTIGPLMAVRTDIIKSNKAHMDVSMHDHLELAAACAEKDIDRAVDIATRHIMRLPASFVTMLENDSSPAPRELSQL